MPQTIPAWTTEDGRTHTDYLKALKHELVIMFARIGENEVGARKIVDHLTKDTITQITDLLEKIEDEILDPTKFQVVRA